jgi:hypothetical protein
MISPSNVDKADLTKLRVDMFYNDGWTSVDSTVSVVN